MLHFCGEMTPSIYGPVMVLVMFVPCTRLPTVPCGTSLASIVPVAEAKKVTVDPFVTDPPPPANICRLSPWLAMEPPTEAGSSTQVMLIGPQSPKLYERLRAQVSTFNVTFAELTESPDTLTSEAGIGPNPPALIPPPKSYRL